MQYALATIVACAQYIIGSHYILFVLYLVLNIADLVSAFIGLYSQGDRYNSKMLVKGIVKKVGYWILVGVSFSVSLLFSRIGSSIGVDLGITQVLGWFVLATLAFHEVRSILENLQKAGVPIPAFLTNILVIAEKRLDEKEKELTDGAIILSVSDVDSHPCQLSLDCSFEELQNKEQITLKVVNKDKA